MGSEWADGWNQGQTGIVTQWNAITVNLLSPAYDTSSRPSAVFQIWTDKRAKMTSNAKKMNKWAIINIFATTDDHFYFTSESYL